MAPSAPAKPRSRAPPRTPVTDAEARSDRRLRAVEEVLEVRPLSGYPFAATEVRNPAHQTRYTVFFPAHPSREGGLCTCDDFARRGIGTCKHLEAAALRLTEEPPPAPPGPPVEEVGARWAEVDARWRAVRDDPRPEALKFRSPGSSLFERHAGPTSPVA